MEFSSSSSVGFSLPVLACVVEEGMLSLDEAAAEEAGEAALEASFEVVLHPASTPHSSAAQTSRERIRLRIIQGPPFIGSRQTGRGRSLGLALVYCAVVRLSISVCRTNFNRRCANCTNFSGNFRFRVGLTIFALARIIHS